MFREYGRLISKMVSRPFVFLPYLCSVNQSPELGGDERGLDRRRLLR